LESDPRAWLQLLLGRELGEVRILNLDLSTITNGADSVLLVEETEPWLVHVEFRLFSQLSGWNIACDGLETP